MGIQEEPRHVSPLRQRVPRWWVTAGLLLVSALLVAVGLASGRTSQSSAAGAGSAPSSSGAFSAATVSAPAAPTTTSRPVARRLGVLIMQNIGTGETDATQNRVYFLGRDTKPGPGLHIFPAAIQPVDVDPRPDVRRVVNMAYRDIIARARRGERFHPSPLLVARPGERVELVIQNRDIKLHSFTYDPADAYKDVFAHKTRTYEFTVPRDPPPRYNYYCRWRFQGMDGLFEVKGPPVPK
jgi:hypothetical protein